MQTAMPPVAGQRQMRVTHDVPARARVPSVAAAASFASQLASRYRSRRATAPGLALLLGRAGQAIARGQVQSHASFTVSPQVRLTLITRPADGPRAQNVQPSPGPGVITLEHLVMRHNPPAVARHRDEGPVPRRDTPLKPLERVLVGMLAPPAVRVERERVVLPAPAVSVPMIVRQSGGRQAGPEYSTAGAREPQPGWSPARPAGDRQAPAEPGGPAPASADLGRLTDQVLQAIDRRLQAHRERTGRM